PSVRVTQPVEPTVAPYPLCPWGPGEPAFVPAPVPRHVLLVSPVGVHDEDLPVVARVRKPDPIADGSRKGDLLPVGRPARSCAPREPSLAVLGVNTNT